MKASRQTEKDVPKTLTLSVRLESPLRSEFSSYCEKAGTTERLVIEGLLDFFLHRLTSNEDRVAFMVQTRSSGLGTLLEKFAVAQRSNVPGQAFWQLDSAEKLEQSAQIDAPELMKFARHKAARSWMFIADDLRKEAISSQTVKDKQAFYALAEDALTASLVASVPYCDRDRTLAMNAASALSLLGQIAVESKANLAIVPVGPLYKAGNAPPELEVANYERQWRLDHAVVLDSSDDQALKIRLNDLAHRSLDMLKYAISPESKVSTDQTPAPPTEYDFLIDLIASDPDLMFVRTYPDMSVKVRWQAINARTTDGERRNRLRAAVQRRFGLVRDIKRTDLATVLALIGKESAS